MVVNNWFVIVDGVAAAAGSPVWSRLYFVSFWFLSVVIVLNLVVAFVLDAFLTQVNVSYIADCLALAL